ncbi:hypothetical protein BOSE62_130498 [Bosea sp. 62]|nr:hypothetical protein BOSE7B_120511 [Bosea sp. 7B]CAD5276629.1 hypothetical protein BOSE21B_30402 [Bosea sp. 21B]CAD5277773.1 hypothetical protein BOSE46_40052 [Bosea sp. 46]VVT59859.1 hypothetical protein BOS5A_210650 [Bosea sp. EC-HK365B]VXB46422.1 hypothetical protein BOSE62_130498 [Bosea sp. 62]VXC07925.1 hypothetical protein BOSE127_170151 [Bosea sp. 127]VXC22779.1 hypothetical protein BOSE29B_30380 [Bosea sp. 29B]VXC75413.1 hypothetical protein BOSE125_50052 [Bosea sp. 125]
MPLKVRFLLGLSQILRPRRRANPALHLFWENLVGESEWISVRLLKQTTPPTHRRYRILLPSSIMKRLLTQPVPEAVLTFQRFPDCPSTTAGV